MRLFLFYFFVCSGLLIISCSGKDSGAYKEQAGRHDKKALTSPSSSPQNVDTTRKLVKTGKIRFQTENLDSTKAAVDQLVKKYKGYMGREERSASRGQESYWLTVRIPADNFASFLQEIEKLAVDVDNKTVEVQDKTEEYIDMATRLKNKRELEQRYRELLEQAESVKEILSIEKELSQVREDIESVEGRLNHLKKKVAYSTLVIYFYEDTGASLQFWESFENSLAHGWRLFLQLILLLGRLWVLFVIGGLSYLGYLLLKR